MIREATVKKIQWGRDGNPWKILKMDDGSSWKGDVGDVVPGTLLRAECKDEPEFSRYGTTHIVEKVLGTAVKGVDAIEQWIAYRLPQVGPERARQIVDLFGEGVWDVLKADPAALCVVPGITAERSAEIAQVYAKYESEHEAVVRLVGLGLPMGVATRAAGRWPNVQALLERDPYDIMDVDGATFDMVDAAAQQIGMQFKDPRRARAWVRNELENDLDNGHCYRNVLDVVVGLTRWGIPGAEAQTIITEARALSVRDGKVQLARIARAERSVANCASRISGLRDLDPGVLDQLPDWLDPSQRAAVAGVVSSGLSVLTGGPGTGKTTCLKAALDVFDSLGLSVELASPTGKAAKRLSQVVNRPAKTVHRLLGWTLDGWTYDASNPVPAHVIVIDEASMLDVELAGALCDAVPDYAVLLLVGDVDQLPPVGPGQPLYDLISGGSVPVYRLDTTHRQAGDSWVIDNAKKIIDGQVPDLTESSDFDFVELGSTDDIIATAVHLYKEEPTVQIFTPEHKNGAGTVALNLAIQEACNPRGRFDDCYQAGSYKIYAADKVLYTRNNRDLGLVNGDLGVVERVEVRGTRVTVYVHFESVHSDAVPDGHAALEGDHARPLTLAYAMTVHKCVAPDTLVWTDLGMMRFDDVASSGAREVTTADGLKAFTEPFMRARSQKCVCITTKSGYEVTVSLDHKLMAWTGAKYKPVEAKDLADGQFLRLRLGGETGGSKQELPAFPGDLDVRAVVQHTPRSVTDRVAEFLGLMVADGTVYRRGFRLVKRHRDVVERFVELCREIFWVEVEVKRMRNCWGAEVNSVGLSVWLREVGGMEPNKKAIPQVVLRSPKYIQAAFLRGLFEDGTVNLNHRKKNKAVVDHVEWSNMSREIVRQVQVMLLGVGVISSRKRRSNRDHKIYIYGQNAKKFEKFVGFVSSFKNDRMKSKAGAETRYLVPVPRSMTHELPKSTDRCNARTRGYVSRAVAEQAGWTEQLKFHHDAIASLKIVQSRVGCLTVPGTGRFLQNGFDGCNSQGSEWENVAVVCDEAHRSMRRQLLYTGVTRTRDHLVLLGSREAVERAVSRPRDTGRKTLLVERLREATT